MRGRLLTPALALILVAACSSNSRPPAPPASNVTSALRDGVYRTHTLTWSDAVAAIKAVGFSDKEAANAHDAFGFNKNVVFTIKLQGGRWTQFEQDDGGPDQQGSGGTYTLTGQILVMTEIGGNPLQRLKWTLDGTALSLSTLPHDPLADDPASVAVYTSGPFYRQG
jgi:hypothetical protein